MRLVRFGDLFVDSNTGWTHVCDGSCSLQAPDDAGARFVCPLTGRLHGHIAADEADACGAAAAAAASETVADQDAPTGAGALLCTAC